jgi:hypothetical protein
MVLQASARGAGAVNLGSPSRRTPTPDKEYAAIVDHDVLALYDAIGFDQRFGLLVAEATTFDPS